MQCRFFFGRRMGVCFLFTRLSVFVIAIAAMKPASGLAIVSSSVIIENQLVSIDRIC